MTSFTPIRRRPRFLSKGIILQAFFASSFGPLALIAALLPIFIDSYLGKFAGRVFEKRYCSSLFVGVDTRWLMAFFFHCSFFDVPDTDSSEIDEW